MNNREKNIIVNILVICLYFIWPYFVNSILYLFNLSEVINLYISSVFNFIFLFVVIYIYRKKLSEYYNRLHEKFKLNIIKSIKIFLIGLTIYLLFNALFKIVDVPVLSNQDSMLNMFKKIPVVFVLSTLFYYPVIEEIVFKMSFKDIVKNKWSFVIFTGLFNAFFQIIFSFSNLTDLLYLLPYTAFFSSLSYIFYKNDNILYPILLRICYNLIPCIGYVIGIIINNTMF